MSLKHALTVLGAVVVLSAALFVAAAASKTARSGDDPNNANLTYWYWAESDAPGANNWLKHEVAVYEKAHPKVKVSVVIQSTDTLTSVFERRVLVDTPLSALVILLVIKPIVDTEVPRLLSE